MKTALVERNKKITTNWLRFSKSNLIFFKQKKNTKAIPLGEKNREIIV